jgi:hypothetical protein
MKVSTQYTWVRNIISTLMQTQMLTFLPKYETSHLGSILRSSMSVENFLDKFLSSNLDNILHKMMLQNSCDNYGQNLGFDGISEPHEVIITNLNLRKLSCVRKIRQFHTVDSRIHMYLCTFVTSRVTR